MYQPVKHVPPKLALRYQELSRVLNTSALYQPIFLNDLLPSDSKERYVHLVQLPLAIQNQAVRFTHTAGNNKGNTHFIWRIPVDTSQEELFNENGRVITEIHKSISVYHTRAMRHEVVRSYGCLCNAKPAVLREIYHQLTSDSSANANVQQEQVDERVKLALDCEDEDIIWDLREMNVGRPEKYNVFYDHCQKYITLNLP